MASKCEYCGKAPGFGNRVARLGKGALKRRIKGKSPRRWNPNIQSLRVTAGGGNTRRAHVCASCIKAGKVERRVAAR
jgi:large subunit ribosomal protein L28